jgi:prepilin-type processing-associated H-X9-DG protein
MKKPAGAAIEELRRGLTLIELVVVIAICIILLAILLPAVQLARESARRISCTNNLHQLGIAVAAYTSDFGVVPPGNNQRYSLHTSILPQLDQSGLYNAINFSDRPYVNSLSTGMNATVANTTLNVFLCPSDGGSTPYPAKTNYAGNMGVGYCDNQSEYPACNNGSFSFVPSVSIKPSNFTDGMTNTASMSEWLFSPSPPSRKSEKRSVLRIPFDPESPAQYEEFTARCRAMDINQAMVEPEGRGFNWLHGTILTTLYTHALPIDGRSCVGSVSILGIVTAASQHSGGANVLFADGHVAFTGDDVNDRVWRAMGTRAGND